MPEPVVFSAAWFARWQWLLLLALDAPLLGRWLRWVLCITTHDIGYRRRIVALFPHAYVVANPDGSYTADFRTHDKYAKRIYRAFRPLWHACHAWDLLVANRWQPAWNLGFDTLTTYPDANPETTSVDGFVKRSGVSEAWGAIRAGAGVASDDSSSLDGTMVRFVATAVLDQWDTLARAIALFDTSPLGATAVISAATLSMWLTNKTDTLGDAPDLDIYTSTPASNTALVAADYAQLGAVSQTGAAMTYAAMTINAYNDFVFNATGLGNISLTGVSKFGLRNANYDVANVAPTWLATNLSAINCDYADAAGLANDPKLVVTFTLPRLVVGVSERAAAVALSRVSDVSRAGLAEGQPAPRAALTPAESIRAGLADAAAIRVRVAPADPLARVLLDAAAVFAHVRAAEAPSAGLSERTAVALRLAGSDATRVLLASETPGVRAVLAAAESLRIGEAEAAALLSRLRVSEAVPIGDAEAARIFVRAAASETGRIGLTESPTLLLRVAVAEIFGIGEAEAAALLVRLVAAEAPALGTGEHGFVAVSGSSFVAILVSDSLRIVVAEQVAVRSAVAAGEALAARLGEQAALFGRVAGAEALAARMAEGAAVLARLSPLDSLRLAESETGFAVARVAAADSLGSRLGESVTPVQVLARVAEALGVHPAEAAAILARLRAADAPAVVVAEHGAIVTSSGSLVALTGSENLRLGVAEAAAIRATLSAAERLTAAIAESPALRVAFSVADALRLTAGEAGAVAAIVRASDGARVALLEPTRTMARITAAEAARLGAAEITRALVRLGVAEAALPLGAAESALVRARVAPADAVRVAAADGTLLLVRLDVAADALGVGAAELAHDLAQLLASDAVAVVAEAAEGSDVDRVTPTGVPPSGGPGEVGWTTRDWRIWPTRYTIRRRW